MNHSLQLVIDKHLSTLPARGTDQSTVVRARDSDDGKARIFKLNATLSDAVLVERYALSS
jgi:hypothetical protein